MRDGYYARWRGQEFQASPAGDTMQIYATEEREGFTTHPGGRIGRSVPVEEIEEFHYIVTRCTWRGEPFIVIRQNESWLFLEYVGGRAPVAEALGLDRVDRGVYQYWVPAAEVQDIREDRY